MKTVKRLIIDNKKPDDSLATDSFQRAILQYRNTPYRDTNISPDKARKGVIYPLKTGICLERASWDFWAYIYALNF